MCQSGSKNIYLFFSCPKLLKIDRNQSLVCLVDVASSDIHQDRWVSIFRKEFKFPCPAINHQQTKPKINTQQQTIKQMTLKNERRSRSKARNVQLYFTAVVNSWKSSHSPGVSVTDGPPRHFLSQSRPDTWRKNKNKISMYPVNGKKPIHTCT